MTRTDRVFSKHDVAVIRSISGTIAADSATLTDANIVPAAGFNCRGYNSVLVGVEVDGGTNPTITLEPLFYDGGAADGARWRRLLIGGSPQQTPALGAGTFVELMVYGWPRVYLRRTAVTNATSTTAMRILAIPGSTRGEVVR